MSHGAPERDDASSRPSSTSSVPQRLSDVLGPDGRVPWLLRAPERRSLVEAHDREQDRLAALAARRMALVVLPAVGLAWLVVAMVGSEWVVRAATGVVVVVSVVLAVRAAVTVQRFRRRWLEAADRVAPPIWVTLLTVGAVVGLGVALANVVADVQAGRTAVWSIGFFLVFLGMAVWGTYAHLAGGQSVRAALDGVEGQAVGDRADHTGE